MDPQIIASSSIGLITSMVHFSIFKSIVLVLRPATLIIRFTLLTLISSHRKQLFQ